jgi:hypothetical protein
MISAFHIDETEFPKSGTLEEQARFLICYATLAPSTHNTQPWKFGLSSNGIAVYADYARRLPVVDPGNRELLMSIGAAVASLRIAAAHFGFECRVDYNLSGDSERPVAFVTLTPTLHLDAAAVELQSLFPAIAKRHTNRNPFLMTRIPASVISMLQKVAEGRAVSVRISTDGALNQKVGDLVAVAEQKLLSDSEYRKDSAEWVRPNWTARADGVPGVSLGLHGVAAALAPWATRVLDLGRIQAARDKNLCVEAPGLVVLASEDGVPYFLETGEVLGRILLTLTREGLQTSYFNMLIQAPETRLQLRALLGLSSWPQLLLRIGFCLTEPGVTPRRDLEDVIIATADA